MKIFGVVVLYYPNESVLENIKSYIRKVATLYIVDNSDVVNSSLIQCLSVFENVVYIHNNGNQGIAKALNLGAKLAIEDNATWLLTMDQDSKFENDNLDKLIQCLVKYDLDLVAIVSPIHVLENTLIKPRVTQNLSPVEAVMTSGNLLNLRIYKKIGDFVEKLFIDAVDQEYCLRARSFGYKILVCEYSLLQHSLGDLKEIKLGHKFIRYSNHSALRRYYITRNRLYLLRNYFFKFPMFGFRIMKWIVFEWLKIFLFEEDKIAKSKAILEGIRDFLRGKYGKHAS